MRNAAELAIATGGIFESVSKAAVCYVYQADISPKDDPSGSRWHIIGRSLQALLAPTTMKFYARNGNPDDRLRLCDLLHKMTPIDKAALQVRSLDSFAVHTTLQWIELRGQHVTRLHFNC